MNIAPKMADEETASEHVYGLQDSLKVNVHY